MELPQKIIAIDFDGTIVDHRFPALGAPAPYALETMRELQSIGFKIILWTVRNHTALKEAVGYLKEAGIELWGINENPDQKYWASGPKAYASFYVDDAAVGCPLILPDGFRRHCVDWQLIARDLAALYQMKLLSHDFRTDASEKGV